MLPPFEHPGLLVFIPIAMALVWLFARQKSALGYSTFTRLRGTIMLPLDHLQKILLCVAVTSAIVALAGPFEYRTEAVPVQKESRDLLLVLDGSSSMTEGNPPKIVIAKKVIGEFIENHPHDRIGLVSFVEKAKLEWPLSFDHRPVLRQLGKLRISGATRIDKGLLTALEHFFSFGRKGGVIILISDGESIIDPPLAMRIELLVKETEPHLYFIWIEGGKGKSAPDVKDFIESLGGKIYQTAPAELQAIFSEISRLETAPVIYEEKTTATHNYGPILFVMIASLFAAAFLELVKEI